MTRTKKSQAEDGDALVARGRWGFLNRDIERIYCSFRAREKRNGVICFIMTSILYNIYMSTITCKVLISTWCIALFFIIANITLLRFVLSKNFQEAYESGKTPIAIWCVAVLQVTFHHVCLPLEEVVHWVLLFLFLACFTLPLSKIVNGPINLMAAVLFEIHISKLALPSTHYNATYTMAYDSNELVDGKLYTLSIFARLSMYIGVIVLGLVGHYAEDLQRRQSFVETKKSLQVKLEIEEQSQEQERLLLSVLPEHVAVQMRQDLGAIDTQFKKIYMSRHENVSILYADIVGFTAISSTYSAQDLVAILNELFARFDKLAEKYHQLRIKILGDCYYCISGAPVERPDHAVLCVHMGLSMVKAIKYVQQITSSPVDMRVGIHTGAVLAGVLGQRQWQFDVYSRDVELANKMESSGMAGRVHISDKTLKFLDRDFEVEPAFGEKREEALRLAGIKTYFIVKVLKPFQSSGDANGDANLDDAAFPETPSDMKDDDDESVISPQDEKKLTESNENEDFLQRLKDEVTNKEYREVLKEKTGLSLMFDTWEMEVECNERQDYNYIGTVSAFIAHALLAQLAPVLVLNVLPRESNEATGALGPEFNPFFCAVFLLCSALCATIIHLYYAVVYHLGMEWSPKYLFKCALNTLAVVIMFIPNTISMALSIKMATDVRYGGTASDATLLLSCCGVLLMAGVLVALHLPAYCKVPFICLASLLHLWLTSIRDDDEGGKELQLPLQGKTHLIAIYLITPLIFTFVARYMDWSSRLLFVRATRMSERSARADDMRRRNEALVYNVLPPHVAVHFMGQRVRHHRDLYSQSYAEVGVLFASMPNFSDFYSEETVNNQGLECLRFLNEVISDFDALLEQPSYKDIIKIKTIGSTYMAASGLNPSVSFEPTDSIERRWAHLATLVEFALELKRALQGINEQSFNHFVLKMGVNHGPITAGVIGARKPHYDIWGNTVNVASRMESTGKAGCIQVTDETCKILEVFGYYFEQRGLVAVKGKGQLMTYYLQGRSANKPTVIAPPTMETVVEEEYSSQNSGVEEKGTFSSPSATNTKSKSPNGSLSGCNGVAVSPSRAETITTSADEAKQKLLNDEGFE